MNDISKTAIFASLAIGFLAGCGSDPVPASLPAARPVKMIMARAMPPAKIYSAAGVLQAVQRAELSFDRTDTLVELSVCQGQKVSKGEVLAKIDMHNLDIQRASVQARYDEAYVQHQRIQRLYRKAALAQADLDRAKATLETARAELMQVQRDMERSVLTAPFAGRVAATFAERYQAVPAGRPVLVLHDISRFDIRIHLPESFILDVDRTTDVRARAFFDHLPGQSFPARVREFSTEADPATLTYSVVLQMDALRGKNLLPGMAAGIQLSIHENPGGGVWIPQEAVFSMDGQRSCVWRVNKQMRVKLETVQTGLVRQGEIQIVAGLSAGETVVVSGVHALREEMPVKPYDL